MEHAKVISKSEVALKVFFNICKAWSVEDGDAIVLLGNLEVTRFDEWRESPVTAQLSHEVLERISYILGIYKGLQILLPNPIAADAWIKKTNSEAIFGGKSALEKMLQGRTEDLAAVRQYIDSLLGEESAD